MVLVEHDVWDADSTTTSLFVNSLRKLENPISPKLFVLANLVTFLRTRTITSDLYAPGIIVKPLRSSMLAACLQQEMGVGSKGNLRNGEFLPRLA
ncbi:hypothetical protein LINPERHAP2_LOCUS85 [Linum perenne]